MSSKPRAGDLPGAQPQPGQQQHDRVVPPPGRGAPVTGGQQRPQLRRRPRPAAGRTASSPPPTAPPPPATPGPARSDAASAGTSGNAQTISFADPVARPGASSQHEPGDIGRRSTPPGPAAHRGTRLAMNGRASPRSRAPSPAVRATLGEQVAAVAAQQLLHRVEPDRLLGTGSTPSGAKNSSSGRSALSTGTPHTQPRAAPARYRSIADSPDPPARALGQTSSDPDGR